MIILSQRDNVDLAYTRFQLNDLLNSDNISLDLKNFLCLNVLLHEPGQNPEVKQMMRETYAQLGESIRKEILGNMERWLKSHTKAEYLLNWDEYNSDKEITWAWSLVKNGEMSSHNGFEFDIKPLVAKRLVQLAREFYGHVGEEDKEGLEARADELAMGYGEEAWQSLNEDFREFIARKYSGRAFQAWKRFWGQALVQPTKDVTAAVKRLRNCSLEELGPAISMALNAYHVHGKMIEHTNLRSDALDYLHEMPESDIEEFKKQILGEPELALTANYVPNQKSKMPSPIKKNYDYGEIPNWIDRVEFEEKKREERKARIDIILKTTTFEGRMERMSQREQPSLIMTVGITGAGKSRWIQSLPKDEYVIVSPDDIRQELTGNMSDQTQNGKVWFLTKQRTVDALNAGKSVILDATNVDRKNRKNFIHGLPSDIKLKAKIFEVDPEIAKERIRKQIERGENRSNVPPHVTDNMYQKFKSQSQPKHLEEEGFEIIK